MLEDAREATVSRREPDVLEATIDAPEDGWVWIDRAWWPALRTTVDGQGVTARRALAGQLVPVGAGRHTVRSELIPWDAGLGLVVGVVAVLAAIVWARPQRRGDRPLDPSPPLDPP